MKPNKKALAVFLIGMSCRLAGYADDALTAYRGAHLVDHPVNDGDSFMVSAGDKIMHIRLYFVDSPETKVTQTHDARRIQEQARYFGLDQPDRILWLGDQSASFTREVLSKPFTLYTSHAKAMGGSGSERLYGFVVTSAGRDLGELLVENGLGRNFGVARNRYDGLSRTEVESRLRDLEISAMLAHRGIWKESNPNTIVESRAKLREERESMNAIMGARVLQLGNSLNVNTASQRELERIPGVGPVLAERIIQNRPYRSVEDLKSVRGLGGKLFEAIAPYVYVNGTITTNG